MKGPETQKSEERRIREGFFSRFMRGEGLDIGYKGSLRDQAEPVWPSATGVDEDYPGYDGKKLPFADESQDYVYSSHCLEHIKDPMTPLKEWFRVVKTGGHLVITVPHRDLYEKKAFLGSRWNGAHKRFYTPASLLAEVEAAFEVNSYRIRYMQDCDEGYDYSIPPTIHPHGEYQIEIVIQKIQKPAWSIFG